MVGWYAAGGAGGAFGVTAGAPGDRPPTSKKAAGGGGGGVGRIAIKTLDGTVDNQGASLSTAPTDLASDGNPPATIGSASFL